VLVEQLGKAALQLEEIAQEQGLAPLELQIADLVRWGQRQADQRLAITPPEP